MNDESFLDWFAEKVTNASDYVTDMDISRVTRVSCLSPRNIVSIGQNFFREAVPSSNTVFIF